MKTLTMLQKAFAICLISTLWLVGTAGAQGIIPPDEPSDLPGLPSAFNVDTDEIDWEGFTMFPFEGAGLVRIENPDQSGLNTTNFVIEYKKGGAGEGGQPWAGFFYHTAEPLVINDDAVFRLRVWSPRSGITGMMKLEMKDFPDVATPDMFVNINDANQWVELEWDLSMVDRNTPWDRIVIIMDLQGSAGDAGDNFTWYLDDFVFDNGLDTSTGENFSDIPQTIELNQNYPNPFNPTTNISFAIPEAGQVTLEVFDMLGQKVATVVNQTLSAGQHTVSFDASNLSSGMYLYRLNSGNQVQTRKLTLIK
ncbi:MAG: T9SS type A sorting domain-containing protein [Balneolales bacterium]|nr:T9SS type A sorting domain-containing protein [Balneolales bacterium]